MNIKDYAQMMSYLTRPRDVVPEPRPMAQGGRIGFKDGMKAMEDEIILNYKKKRLKELEAGKKPSEIQSYEDYIKTQTEVDMNPGKKKLDKAIEDAKKLRKKGFTLSANPFFDPSMIKKVISDLGKGVNVGLGPSGILLLNSILGVDPKQSIDRAGLGLEAALAKPLVKGAISVTDKIKNPTLRKIAERAALAGMSPTMAMKVASRLSPIGIASLGLEGLYQIGKLGYEDQQRFNALSPKEQAAERAEQQELADVSA